MSIPSSRRASLFARLVGYFSAVVVTVLVAAALIAMPALDHQAQEQMIRQLTVSAKLMEADVATAFTQPTIQRLQPLAVSLGQRAGSRVTIIDPQGRVLGDSDVPSGAIASLENHRHRPEVEAAFAGSVGHSVRYSKTVKRRLLYVAQPIYGQDRLLGVLRLAVPLTAMARLHHEIRRSLGAALAVGLVVALILGAWLAYRISTPLARLTRRAEHYARGKFDVPPVTVGTVREIEELSAVLQSMAQAIRGHIEALTIERNQATAILESLMEGVIAVDDEGKILVANAAASLLLGVPGPALAGRSVFETVRHDGMQALVRRVLESGHRTTQEVTLFAPRERLLRVHASPCARGGEAGPRVVLVIQDMTEHGRYEQLRKEFVANVSHELKSPLTAIRSLTETLLEGGLDDPTHNRRFVHSIDEEAARLTRLIEDLLQLSQIESQAVPLRPAPVELARLAEEVIASLQAVIVPRRLTVRQEISPELLVSADPDRLRQVFLNLLENAVKYNRQDGSITLSAETDVRGVIISIADTGIGIPQVDLPRIFERFYRVDKARSRELGGTGLGLSIVKHIIEAHGGRIWVDSHLNQSSTFYFTLPSLKS